MNKVFLFGIWCLFLTLSVDAQKNSLKTQLQLLQIPLDYEFPLDSTGFSAIKNAKFYTKSGDTDVFNITNKNIHIVDVNNDGEKDIIYQDNRHYQATAVFVKKDNDFVEIWNRSGALVYIQEGEQTTIYILRNAIGCLYRTMLSELIVNKDNSFIENLIGLHTDTKLTTLDTTLEQKTLSGILRTQPVIDDTNKTDPCSGDLKIGNQIGTIDNKEVTVIKTQNEWLLVVLKEKDSSVIGWIKI